MEKKIVGIIFLGIGIALLVVGISHLLEIDEWGSNKWPNTWDENLQSINFNIFALTFTYIFGYSILVLLGGIFTLFGIRYVFAKIDRREKKWEQDEDENVSNDITQVDWQNTSKKD